MKLINLTPHTVHIISDVVDIEIKSISKIARCKETTKPAYRLNNVDFIYREYNEVYDLPEPEDDVIYIVSLLVRQALPDRKDLASPGDLIRDDSGNIIGTKNLVVNQ